LDEFCDPYYVHRDFPKLETRQWVAAQNAFTRSILDGLPERRVVRGPVIASGYSWYLVKLAPGVLHDGITQGWLAEADRDGTLWIKNIPID
jgi:hypothetical protein